MIPFVLLRADLWGVNRETSVPTLDQPFPVSPDQSVMGHESKITLMNDYRHAHHAA